MTDHSARFEARARDLAHLLVGWPSVTGTADEAAFPHRLAEVLRAHPSFAQHPDNLVVAPIPGDPLGRSNLLALVRGSGRRTVILSGHFDVVPVNDYGDLAPLATRPEVLRSALIERLRRSGAHPQALHDLETGAFVPGRGMLDMKSGLAAGLAVLEDFASGSRSGNLLFVTTPDEEDRSAGMRALADMLPEFLRTHDLDPALAINLDAICDDEDGSTGRVVTIGCVGKLLLSALVVGRESHACYPFAGVNAAYLAAEIAAEIEGAPELGETVEGEIASPPTLLGAKDGKGLYNVTTPADAWLFWNVLTFRRSAADVLAIAKTLTDRAVARAAARIRERAERGGQGERVTDAWGGIAVLTYAELADRARARHPNFDAAVLREGETLRADPTLDLPTASARLTRFAWSSAGLDGPAVVLGFGSMPYPSIDWDRGPAVAVTATQIRAAVADVSARFGTTLGLTRFFPAIADMSFLGGFDAAGLRVAAANTPIWDTHIRWNLNGDATPGIPIVNAGPWGRDYHHWLERTHADYTFRVLPALVAEIVDRVLS